MRWVAENTEPGTAFVVPTEDVWGDDEQSEWFPALAGRQSVGTVQGSEWLGAEGYAASSNGSGDSRLRGRDSVLLPRRRRGRELLCSQRSPRRPISPEDCCPALRESLVTPGYEIVYDGPGATIAQPTD